MIKRPLKKAASGRKAGGKEHYAPALGIEDVEIDAHCIGSRWTVADFDRVARIVAIIAMGQAAHAATIIAELRPAEPAIDDEALRRDAKRALSIQGSTDTARRASRYHRDGFIFETISWAAAQQDSDGTALLSDPHIRSTTQGPDGLMLEIDGARSELVRATIFEDKCSENPRRTFRTEVMPTFLSYHRSERAAELLAKAALLLEKSGLNGTNATTAAARVLDATVRAYRGSLAITTEDDSAERRQRLFRGYDKLEGIDARQRIGAVLVTATDLRGWFDDLAERAVAYIGSLGSEDG